MGDEGTGPRAVLEQYKHPAGVLRKQGYLVWPADERAIVPAFVQVWDALEASVAADEATKQRLEAAEQRLVEARIIIASENTLEPHTAAERLHMRRKWLGWAASDAPNETADATSATSPRQGIDRKGQSELE